MKKIIKLIGTILMVVGAATILGSAGSSDINVISWDEIVFYTSNGAIAILIGALMRKVVL